MLIELEMNKFIIVLILYCISYTKASSQSVRKINAFTFGEKLIYQGYYNWGFIWIHAADIQFSVTNKNLGTCQAYWFEADATSLPSYDWFYKVKDKFQSLVISNNFSPVWFEQNTSEGGYTVHQTYSFDTNQHRMFRYGEFSNKPKIRDTVEIPSSSFDVLTSIYYSRNIDFEKYTINDRFTIHTIIDGVVYAIYIRYLGKDFIKMHDQSAIYRCIKFSVLAVDGTIFKGGENIMVWVTDDEDRIPVMVEAKILVGSVRGYLKSAVGLKNELSAKYTK